MAKTAPEKVSFAARFRQIGMVFSFTARRDRMFVPLALAAVLVPVGLGVVLFVIGAGWIWIAIGVMLALLALLIVLNLRSNKAMMIEAESQPGASARIVELMRGNWRVSPAISASTDYDMVHLVVGRPGVILLGEGPNKARVRSMIGQEKRRVGRVIGSTDLRDFMIGHGEGEVPIAKLRATLSKLPRSITPKDVNALDTRLKALAARPQMPQGSIPKSMRPPKGAFRAMRGR
jgi:hypothetical protein